MHRTWTVFLSLLPSLFFPLNAGENLPVPPSQYNPNLSPSQWIQTALVEAEALIENNEYSKLNPLYSKILELQPELYLSQEEYYDFLITYAYSSAYLNQFDLALNQMQELEETNLTQAQCFRRKLLISKLYFSKGEVKKAAYQLHEILQDIPVHNWGMEDRTFLLNVLRQAHLYFDNLIEQANHAFKANLYDEASQLYFEALEGFQAQIYKIEDRDVLTQLYLRTAQSLYFTGKLERTRDLLLEAYSHELIHLNGLYLLMLSYKELGDYPAALKYCKQYLNCGPHQNPDQLEAVEFEIARLHYLQAEYGVAKKLLFSLLTQQKSPHFQALSRFYLARIHLKTGETHQVESWLHAHHFDFEKCPHLKKEWSYLCAELSYEKKEYASAIKGFEEALSSSKSFKLWHIPARSHLGRAYLKEVEASSLSDALKKTHLANAESNFVELLKQNPTDENLLQLAQVYLLQFQLLEDQQAASKLERLALKSPFSSQNAQLEMRWIQVEMEKDLEKKEALLATWTSLEALSEAQRAKHRFLRAQNLFYLSANHPNDTQNRTLLELLHLSWKSLTSLYPQYVSKAIKIQALTALKIKDLGLLKENYLFFDQFLEHYPGTGEVKEETFYFKALIASKIMQLEENSDYYERGVESLQTLLSFSSHAQMKEQALYLLGTLFYQNEDFARARHTFLKLIENHPNSKWLGDAWYWAAECNDSEKHDPSISKEYRKKVFENYPSSSHADQAYFYYYPFVDYLEAKPDALAHLKEMESLFSNSPFLIVGDYLLALGWQKDHLKENGSLITEKDLVKSTSLFGQVAQRFEKFYTENKMPKEKLKYFAHVYYKSLLGKAKVLKKIAKREKVQERARLLSEAIKTYQTLLQDFKSKTHPLAQLFYAEQSYPELLQEAEFGLAKAYIKNFQLQEGEQKFNQIIEHSQTLGIQKSYYSSRAWYELALISMAKEDYLKALKLLNQSHLAASEQVSPDQITDISIQESLCYRFSGQLDLAMLTLSKIINEEGASNLKVKAMYLRAEVYEIQGRQELAQRQFEDAAKKEGEWARMSQDRLIAEYGMN